MLIVIYSFTTFLHGYLKLDKTYILLRSQLKQLHLFSCYLLRHVTIVRHVYYFTFSLLFLLSFIYIYIENKPYGIESVFNNVIEELVKLANDGIILTINGEQRKVFFMCGAFTGNKTELILRIN